MVHVSHLSWGIKHKCVTQHIQISKARYLDEDILTNESTTHLRILLYELTNNTLIKHICISNKLTSRYYISLIIY